MNRWKEDFRISGRAFEKLVSLLCGSLERQDTHFQKAIPVKKRVAVALWRLASGYYFRATSKTLAVRKSTSLEITNKFREVESRYERLFIKFPINRSDFWRDTEETMLKPLQNLDNPKTVLFISRRSDWRNHVPVLVPNIDSKPDYFCRKQEYSVINQAVIGNNFELFLKTLSFF